MLIFQNSFNTSLQFTQLISWYCLSTNLHSKIQFKAIPPCAYHCIFCEESLSGFLVALFGYWKAVVKGFSEPSFLQAERTCSTKYSHFSFEIMYFLFFLVTLSCLISDWAKNQSRVISIPYSRRCMWYLALGSTSCHAGGW